MNARVTVGKASTTTAISPIKHNSTKPNLQLSLTSEGLLEATLPDGRTLELKLNPLSSIYTILHEQMAGNIAMGQNGAPTRHQLWHWEQHSIFADARCTFCRNEGRIKGSRAERNKGKPGARAAALPLDFF